MILPERNEQMKFTQFPGCQHDPETCGEQSDKALQHRKIYHETGGEWECFTHFVPPESPVTV